MFRHETHTFWSLVAVFFYSFYLGVFLQELVFHCWFDGNHRCQRFQSSNLILLPQNHYNSYRHRCQSIHFDTCRIGHIHPIRGEMEKPLMLLTTLQTYHRILRLSLHSCNKICSLRMSLKIVFAWWQWWTIHNFDVCLFQNVFNRVVFTYVMPFLPDNLDTNLVKLVGILSENTFQLTIFQTMLKPTNQSWCYSNTSDYICAKTEDIVIPVKYMHTK